MWNGKKILFFLYNNQCCTIQRQRHTKVLFERNHLHILLLFLAKPVSPNGPAALKPSANTSSLYPPQETNRKVSPVPSQQQQQQQQYAQSNHTSAATKSNLQPQQPVKPPAASNFPMQPNNSSRATQQQQQPVETDNYAPSYSEPQRAPPSQQQQSRFPSSGPQSRGPAPSATPAQPSAAPYLAQQQRPSTVVNPTNCDITMDTSDRMGQQQFRPQESSAMGGYSAQRNPRGRSPMMPQQQQPPQFRQQQQNRPSNMDDLMMMMQQQQQQQQQQQHGVEASGGYNFQRVMDDHFEHYKRPPSRERSVDMMNLPSSLVEAKPVRSSRPPSRCQFHQRFTTSFYAPRSQKRKTILMT